MPIKTEKVCPGCQRNLLRSGYRIHPNGSIAWLCRQCEAEKQAKRRRENPQVREDDRQRIIAWKATHPGEAKAIKKVSKKRRRSRLRNTPATLTTADYRRTLEFFGGGCAYCGSTDELEVEHFIPISKGGGLTPDNTVPACRTCNSDKGGKAPHEWLSDRPSVLWRVTSYLWGVVCPSG